MFVSIGDFLNLKGFLVESLESRRSSENHKPQKIARKVDFSEATPARKDYIHTFLLLELISPQITFQLQENIVWELIPRKLHITYSFVIQRITWKNCLGIIFLENLISVT